MFAIPLDFDFFKHPVYPYSLKEGSIVRHESNSSEEVTSCTIDTLSTCNISDISLEYDAIFDKSYAMVIAELYAGRTSIVYIKVTSIHYQTLSKKDTDWKIDVKNLFVHYGVYCYYLLINVMTLLTKMKNFTTQASRKF